MFGTEPDAKGYERAAEWIAIIERAYAEDAPFDFVGDYYDLKGLRQPPG